MFLVSQVYAWIYFTVKRLFGYQIPGLGFLLRRIHANRMFEISGRKMWFNHKVASSYGLLILGIWQEPETHSILSAIIVALNKRAVAFVDVGANVGEMMIDIGRYKHVTVYGFEPSEECCRAIERSLLANRDKNSKIYNKLVGDSVCQMPFNEGANVFAASVLSMQSASSSKHAEQTTLDYELSLPEEHIVMLINVEGYEPQVLRGGIQLIKQKRPLIIFEYNLVSKQYFSIADIQNILGADYKIFRLRRDVKLDSDVENAWNCVAIPNGSVYQEILRNRTM